MQILAILFGYQLLLAKSEFSTSFQNNNRLNDYIDYYEPFFYNQSTIHQNQRSRIYFRAFGKQFDLELFPGNRILLPKVKLSAHGNNKTKTILLTEVTRCLITGRVIGERYSYVHGSIIDDVIHAIINVPNETYYIEPAKYFFSQELSFSSIIYRHSDINSTAPNQHCSQHHPRKSSRLLKRHRRSWNYENYVDDAKAKPNVCTLRVIVDHVYFRRAVSRSFEKIIAEIVVMLEGVNEIFRKTDFDMDGKPDGIVFKIIEFVIWWSKDQPGYKMTDEQMDIETFLKTVSSYNSADVCLVMAITARNFKNQYGLAVTRTDDVGGICNRLNVAVVTVYFQNQRVTMSLNVQTVAHEFGHSFGAVHDPDTLECKPTDNLGGPYLMNDIAPHVRTNNSHRFSICSLWNISSLFHSAGTKCFIYEEHINYCGNAYVDSPQEECDCGSAKQCDSVDNCCSPPGGRFKDPECKYRRSVGAQCSYREDKCCTINCNIVHEFDQKRCNVEDVCRKPSYCDGINKDCPLGENLPDGTLCHKGVGYCKKGICEDLVCQFAEMNSCLCEELDISCELCCSKYNKCSPAKLWGIVNITEQPILLPDDERCRGGTGVCKNGRCKLDAIWSSSYDIESRAKSTIKPIGKQGFTQDVLIIFGVNCILCIVLLVGYGLYVQYQKKHCREP